MKYSKALVEEIVKYIEEGASDKDAAALAGISKETFYAWQREKITLENGDEKPNPDFKPDFSDLLKKAELKRKKALVNKIITNDSWQAAAWYLERQFNSEFGYKQKIEMEESEDKIKKLLSMLKQRTDEPLSITDKPDVQEQGGQALQPDSETE